MLDTESLSSYRTLWYAHIKHPEISDLFENGFIADSCEDVYADLSDITFRSFHDPEKEPDGITGHERRRRIQSGGFQPVTAVSIFEIIKDPALSKKLYKTLEKDGIESFVAEGMVFVDGEGFSCVISFTLVKNNSSGVCSFEYDVYADEDTKGVWLSKAVSAVIPC